MCLEFVSVLIKKARLCLLHATAQNLIPKLRIVWREKNQRRASHFFKNCHEEVHTVLIMEN